MREKLRIIFWIVVVKTALTKAWWDPCCIKEPGATIRAPAITNRRSLAWFDSRTGPIAKRTDDVTCRSFARTVLRLGNFVKGVNHLDNLFGQ